MNKRFQRVFKFLRGLARDPFLCLWVGAIILFGFVSLGSVPISKSLSREGDFSLANLSQLFDKTVKQDPFLSSIKGFSAESSEFLLVESSSLRAAFPPTTFSPQVLGALVSGYELEDTKKIITEYLVEDGDSLWLISEKFNISLDTLLWANNLNKNSYLQVGQKLIILPVSGVLHHIKAGDTISEIAQKYKGKTDEIIAFNNLSNEGDIYVGDIIVVPDGIMPVSAPKYAPQLVPLADSYFICPISQPCRITQGLHWYNAIDFSHGKCGEPIYAVAAGQVLKVKLTNSTSRWAFGGAGNNISILHPNGVVTTYGHIAVSLVNPGDSVSQGQIIALMGGQPGTPGAGKSTGCHIHFGVSGARNPFSR